jgi:outer membrane protein insertion porin family
MTAPAYNQPAYSVPAATAPNYTAPAPNYAPQPTVDGRFVPPTVTQPAAPVTQGLPAPGFGNQADPAFGQPGVAPVEGPYSPPFFEEPDGFVDIDSEVQETQTGRFMFGVGVNSDAGLVGSIVVDEQNFDWRRWPRNGWEDFRNGTAFRGGGQRFRLEAAPGTQVQRYLINFSEPYLFDTPIGMGLSGFYYTRGFTDWTEERLGGRVNLSYQFSPDLSGNLGFGGQAVDVFNPRQPTPPALAEVLGNTSIYTFTAGLAHDTRDNTFLSTEGHRLALTLEQTIGDFVFPRINLEARKFFTLRERPDGSSRAELGWADRFFGRRHAIVRPVLYRWFFDVARFPLSWGRSVRHGRERGRRLYVAGQYRIHVPHYRRRHGAGRGVCRYWYGQRKHRVVRLPCRPRFGLADYGSGVGPRPHCPGLCRARGQWPRRPRASV